MLKNAKDAAATEALEIATYTAIERLATGVGDDRTAKLAASIRADEQRMLDRILALLPALTDAVAAADLRGEGTYKVARDRRGRRRAHDRPQGRAHDAPDREVDRAARARTAPGAAARRGRREGRGRPRAGSPDRALRRAERRGDRRPPDGPLPGRPGQDRGLRAQGPGARHHPRAHRHAAHERAVGRLRRPERRRDPQPARARAGGPGEVRARVRARAQGPRGRARGDDRVAHRPQNGGHRGRVRPRPKRRHPARIHGAGRRCGRYRPKTSTGRGGSRRDVDVLGAPDGSASLNARR